MQNGFIERFNRTYREAFLNMYIFESLEDFKLETEKIHICLSHNDIDPAHRRGIL